MMLITCIYSDTFTLVNSSLSLIHRRGNFSSSAGSLLGEGGGCHGTRLTSELRHSSSWGRFSCADTNYGPAVRRAAYASNGNQRCVQAAVLGVENVSNNTFKITGGGQIWGFYLFCFIFPVPRWESAYILVCLQQRERMESEDGSCPRVKTAAFLPQRERLQEE